MTAKSAASSLCVTGLLAPSSYVSLQPDNSSVQPSKRLCLQKHCRRLVLEQSLPCQEHEQA